LRTLAGISNWAVKMLWAVVEASTPRVIERLVGRILDTAV
jgi:hypothetical protein